MGNDTKNNFRIFPLKPNSKLPAISGFPEKARPDFPIPEGCNIGISTEDLLVVDVDVKKGKDGFATLLELEIQGFELPPTYTQTTPSGGSHLVYSVTHPVQQGTDVLGRGLDVRARGGYIVAAGSVINGRRYSANSLPVAPAPEWLVRKCGQPRERKPAGVLDLNVERAAKRATEYLRTEAPIAKEGESGDQTTFAVAARLKDFGCGKVVALDLLLEYWNPRCEPPWSVTELSQKVENAYRYGSDQLGIAAPEADFDSVPIEGEEAKGASHPPELHPFERLNQEFAFVLSGGGSHILWETKGTKGEFFLDHLQEQAFHKKFASETITIGDGKTKPLTELWMRAPNRRSYDRVVFMPGKTAPKNFYNLWRGFAVEPYSNRDTPSARDESVVAMFFSHALENVCAGDEKLFNWLIGYFAHLVQRPWEKPLTALVFKGRKGTGKNALVERVSHLLGRHGMVTADKRYLLGNFNGHFENNLLFVLDEAFWSGDKQAEGALKNLITGATHVIERKGQEQYVVDNCTRVAVIGNEDWLIPASEDERRYAVFNVGEGRMQDRKFFQEMREGLEAGGYRLLLRKFMDFDISGIDLNDPPKTQGLADQKIASLGFFEQWWLQCLTEGSIVPSDFGGAQWATAIEKDRVRQSYRQYTKERNIGSKLLSDTDIGRRLKKLCPEINTQGSRMVSGKRFPAYLIPELSVARAAWDKFIGHASDWPNEL